MLIDFHVHLGDTVPVPPGKRLEVSVHQLIDRMDREGIDRTVLLPLESPEAISGYYLTRDALRAYETYPERLIAFVTIDPRMPNLADLVALYETRGCVGFGELKNSVAFDDPLNKAIYKECNERGWALVFHSDPGLCWDEVGLPRLEACLREFPNCKFCAHGPGWWAAISADDERKGGYPTAKVKPGGAAGLPAPPLWTPALGGRADTANGEQVPRPRPEPSPAGLLLSYKGRPPLATSGSWWTLARAPTRALKGRQKAASFTCNKALAEARK